jgi:hypothetical protein
MALYLQKKIETPRCSSSRNVGSDSFVEALNAFLFADGGEGIANV